ncbi:MAG: trimethylamine methyltransferase family protein [Candidatus Thorarchaeota archaeon]|jgi:trimethylamine--corrinoid protein Co-methyltransferase
MTRLNFLSRTDSEGIHAATLEVLEKTGVAVKNEKAIQLLRENGCTIDSETVKIPSSLVEEMVQKTPPSFTLYSRDGKEKHEVGGDSVLYNPASSSIYFKESESGIIRKATADDLAQFVRLVDCMEHVGAQSTAMVPSDVPVSISGIFRLYIILKESLKPIITGAFTKEGLLDMKRILEAAVGGEEELARKPRAVFDCCPLSVLIWGDVSAQNLIDCATHGIPAAIVPAPLVGATSPVTLAGTLVQFNAEVLIGIVIAQLTKPGSPLVYGGATSILDQRYGTSRIGAPEVAIVACASAEMGKFYGIPTHAYLGVSDSKAVDAQSGYESTMGLIQAALAGINIVSGPGMLLSINCQSLEKLVIDNEICGAALRIKEGISLDGIDEIPELIRATGPGGNYLKNKHTRKHLRKEHSFPSDVINRLTLDSWIQSESKHASEAAKDRVENLLKEHQPNFLSDDEQERLDAIMREVVLRNDIDNSALSLFS